MVKRAKTGPKTDQRRLDQTAAKAWRQEAMRRYEQGLADPAKKQLLREGGARLLLIDATNRTCCLPSNYKVLVQPARSMHLSKSDKKLLADLEKFFADAAQVETG